MEPTKGKEEENADKEFLNKLIVGIGEVAEITGVPQRKIRYWEEKGIIQAIPEGETSTRRYNYQNIKKILLIKELLDDGYSLEGAAKKVANRIKTIEEAFNKLKGTHPGGEDPSKNSN